MNAQDIIKKAVFLLDSYKGNKISKEDVWKWAQAIIVSDEYDGLSFEIQDAIHGIWLLHDNDGDWVPKIDELSRIRDELHNLIEKDY